MVSIHAHEARNALASIIGCARTVVDAGEDVDPETRRALLTVIADQALRLDWIMRAAAVGNGEDAGVDETVDARSLLEGAIEFAGIDAMYDAGLGWDVRGDERRLRLGVEALMLALRPDRGEPVVVGREGEGFVIFTAPVDLRHPDRLWKIALARRLIREQGGGVTLRKNSDGIEAHILLRVVALQPAVMV